MDMRQLTCFVAVVEAGSFTRASEQLHTAQSALSRQISNLEGELGLQLFVRMGRGVELTPEGVFAYERAKKLLADFRSFSGEVMSARLASAPRKISVAAHGGIGPNLLPAVAGAGRRLGKDIIFRLSEGWSEHIERDVGSGECDIGVVIRRVGFQVERSELETIRLAGDGWFVVSPEGRDSTPIHARDALSSPLVVAPPGALERASFENWARHHGVTLNVAGEASTVLTRLVLAQQIGASVAVPGLALRDLLAGGAWGARPVAHDDYFQGVEWFLIFRRTFGDDATRAVVGLIQGAVGTHLERNAGEPSANP